ncbi:hypothetical protein NDU88_002133 [Pleurodeles waltl]|uniref:Uncharacterized protein n=1 Tax=Pleurodeles waltl TaxID=8319 RepID=A0AAV7VBP8_PLEWA|nr:hypothetical protein NDU88_002133 [Pleurodeles waltl]
MFASIKLNKPIVISDSEMDNDLFNEDFHTDVAVLGQEQNFVEAAHQEPQLLQRRVSPVINKVQRRHVKEIGMVLVDLTLRPECRSNQLVGGEDNFSDVWQVQVEEGGLHGEGSFFETQHRAADVFGKGCGNASGLHGSKDMTDQIAARKRQVTLAAPVRVRAPSGHRSEERVVPRAGNLTSREWPVESADSEHRLAMEVPSTSQSADISDVQFALADETLDYDDDQEIEEGEICGDEEGVLHVGAQQAKGMNYNKEKSIGVLQGLSSRTVQHNQTCEKDRHVAAVDL